tara:strand:- start:921 stop:1079 length:159 start_codon:yes stop_codon:yes gene_type:complete
MADVNEHKEQAKENKKHLVRPKNPDKVQKYYPNKENKTSDEEKEKKRKSQSH